MDFITLTEDNYTMYAIKHYDNPSCYGEEEFYNDLSRIISIKRLLMKYMRGGELKERLILNHLIVLYNMFGEAATRLLFFRIPKDMHPALKTFLLFMDRVPEHRVRGLDDLFDATIDITVSKSLRRI